MSLMPSSIEKIWTDFLNSGLPHAEQARQSTYTAWQFGYGVAQGNRLLNYVLNGPKRAMAGSLWVYELKQEAIPQEGDFSVILDGDGQARCILLTTETDIKPFNQVDAQFAYDEGEGDRSLAYWREAHWEFYREELEPFEREPEPEMPIVCERFEVVFRDPEPFVPPQEHLEINT